MSFYPIFNVPGFTGITTLHNYAPNNWEHRKGVSRHILALWVENNEWQIKTLGIIQNGESRSFDQRITEQLSSGDSLVFLTLCSHPVEGSFDILPQISSPSSIMPAWRATLALASSESTTSYQGEVDPFPEKASLLSFVPFFQPGEDLTNYFMLLNMEKKAKYRESTVDVIDISSMTILQTANIKSNSLNICKLGNFQIDKETLLVCRSEGMTGVPLYFTHDIDHKYLSLEHTHPPASIAVLGRRWEIQKTIKTNWAKKLP